MTTRRFLKPGEASFSNDRSDIDPSSGTTFKYNPNSRHPLELQRQRLPVFSVRNHVLYLLEKYQTIILLGETGSGKSTQIPQYLYEAGWGVEGMIGITEPRRVACTSLATRVSEEKDCMLGQTVGYTIRFDDCTSPDVTKIKYMTEAILVREMMSDPLLRQYGVIMLDEVHERTIFTDILLGLLKKIQKKRKELRVIVCSATIDAEHMLEFFNYNKTDDKTNDTVSVLSIAGRTYPVDVHYLTEPCADYVATAATTVCRIHLTQPAGHVLVFLTGVEEVNRCMELITQHLDGAECNRGAVSTATVLPMHGSLPAHEQLKVFQSMAPTVRKIIVATNIAETSVTIPHIVYVVDCGHCKVRVCERTGAEGLVLLPTSQAAATQRAGRGGRTQPGKVYRLYPESEFTKLPAATAPEMVRSNLSPVVLNLLALGIDNMLEFSLPSAPPWRHLTAALEELYALSAIDDRVQLTRPLGQRMAEMPLQPALAKMLLSAGEFGCLSEALSIIALLQVQCIFVTPSHKTHKARAQHAKFQVEEGDLITLLNVYTAWLKQERSQRWCSQYYISHKSLCRAEEIRNRMCSLLRKWDLLTKEDEQVTASSRGGMTRDVRRCVTAGLFRNASYLHRSGEYRTVRGDLQLAIHPSSVLYTVSPPPQWLIYHEVLHTSRTFMRDITVIEESWLTELAPHFYTKGNVSRF